MSEKEKIKEMICSDQWMMEVIETAASLGLPDWWVCAGFIRSKVWDVQFAKTKRTLLDDVDVIYYDKDKVDEEIEKGFERELFKRMTGPKWSVKNQARMHELNGVAPYSTSLDGISKFPETATALGVSLDQKGNLILAAPWGVEDVLEGIIRPTPSFKDSEQLMALFNKRLNQKKWELMWPEVKVVWE